MKYEVGVLTELRKRTIVSTSEVAESGVGHFDLRTFRLCGDISGTRRRRLIIAGERCTSNPLQREIISISLFSMESGKPLDIAIDR